MPTSPGGQAEACMVGGAPRGESTEKAPSGESLAAAHEMRPPIRG